MSVSRREMLKVGLGGLSVVSLSGTIPAFLGQFAFADTPSTQPISGDNILVVIQLSGGNDGLNCVVPVGSDEYLKARPVIGIKDRLLKLNDSLALNPGMTAFKDLYDSGQLAIVNGCGYPEPNRSHFRSMEIWQTASPTGHEGSGWLGHYIDHCCRGTTNPLQAVNVGSQLPRALVADSAPVPSINSLEDFAVRVDGSTAAPDAKAEQLLIRQLNAVRSASPAMQFLARQSTNAIVSSEEIRKLTSGGYKPDAQYAPGLGFQLRLMAQIIAANFGTKLFYTEVGGFDTHSNQVNQHEQLLGRVSAAIAAFHKDLAAKGLNKKVTVMCFSEFGRRVTQNDSNGTDHGAPGPMFVSGGAVKGGLYGEYPSLTNLEDGDLKYTTDFRRVYSTLLEKWLNVDSTTVLSNKFETLGFV
ncbi:MAG: DUF1501 domain-containing protein [Planctomycetota bacterium]|nr:DUF1501 domain-containing protein [Planctomycetota bacterium]